VSGRQYEYSCSCCASSAVAVVKRRLACVRNVAVPLNIVDPFILQGGTSRSPVLTTVRSMEANRGVSFKCGIVLVQYPPLDPQTVLRTYQALYLSHCSAALQATVHCRASFPSQYQRSQCSTSMDRFSVCDCFPQWREARSRVSFTVPAGFLISH
jgi:hypothetical protein